MDKLHNIFPKMLGRHLVVDTGIDTLQYAPEALQSVPMHLLSHIFPGAVVHRLMLKLTHPLIGFGFVCRALHRPSVGAPHTLKLFSPSVYTGWAAILLVA